MTETKTGRKVRAYAGMKATVYYVRGQAKASLRKRLLRVLWVSRVTICL